MSICIGKFFVFFSSVGSVSWFGILIKFCLVVLIWCFRVFLMSYNLLGDGKEFVTLHPLQIQGGNFATDLDMNQFRK